MAAFEGCVVCGNVVEDGARWVLVRGRVRDEHCSEACLRDNVGKRRSAAAAATRRRTLRLLLVVLLLAGGRTLWRRFHAPQPQSISYTWPDVRPEAPPPPAPIFFGPAWPPTDEDWAMAFARASWIYPLPGPVRRPTKIDGRIFGPDPPGNHRSLCREEGRCGVDLGGQLWGEHVYAACDGTVDRVQGLAGDARGGNYVRLSHFGGMVFTQYFHLAAVPRRLGRGAHVRAGDVIGLLGDTGVVGSARHLTFALSVRPSSDLPEVYWNPEPLMADWPLRVPANGTVAGFAAPDKHTAGVEAARSRVSRR